MLHTCWFLSNIDCGYQRRNYVHCHFSVLIIYPVTPTLALILTCTSISQENKILMVSQWLLGCSARNGLTSYLKAYLHVLRQKDGLYMLVLLASTIWHWCLGEYLLVSYSMMFCMKPANIRPETSPIWEKRIKPTYRAQLFHKVSMPLIHFPFAQFLGNMLVLAMCHKYTISSLIHKATIT